MLDQVPVFTMMCINIWTKHVKMKKAKLLYTCTSEGKMWRKMTILVFSFACLKIDRISYFSDVIYNQRIDNGDLF